MPRYQLIEDERFSGTAIGGEMFGSNFVASFDYEFAVGSGALGNLSELGVSVFRFPGGTVTEMEFTNLSFLTGDWGIDTYLDLNGNPASMMTLHDFFQSASAVGADAQLVIPTRVAFDQSAGQALYFGTYGERAEIDKHYYELLDGYLEEAFTEAEASGVHITQFEIGNEFWGSGQMTAGEYGFLSAELTAYLSEKYPGVDIVIQLLASTNEYSPLASRTVYLEPIGSGDFAVHYDPQNDTVVGQGWIEATMPGQGSVATQISDIGASFVQNPAALAHLDGVVDHVYFDAGFSGIDSQRDFALNYPFTLFSNITGRQDLEFYITEWSPRNATSTNPNLNSANQNNSGNANGLQLAHTTVEAFFELASNGVDGANYWPLTFGNPNIDSRVLIDTTELDLTFSGAAFQMLASSVIGLRPVLDLEVAGEVDVHGFSDDSRTVFFVGERSGRAGQAHHVSLEVGQFRPSQHYFVNVTTLNSDDGSFDIVDTDPSILHHDGYTQSSAVVSLDMNAWDLSRVELQAVTNQGDQIFGRDGNDRIYGMGGNDRISGGGGSNFLDGGSELDTAIFEGIRSDYSIVNSSGDPLVWLVTLNGETDTLVNFEAIQFADETIYLVDVNGSGSFIFETHLDDSLHGNSGHDIIEGDLMFGGQDNDLMLGGYGRDIILGGHGNDRLFGENDDDQLYGEGGDDTLFGSGGNDRLYGGPGNDRLFGEAGNDKLVGGAGRDVLFGGNGTDVLIGKMGDDKLFGGADHDRLMGNRGNDKLFGQLGDDHLEGHEGNDLLLGGQGNDLLKGGLGNDTLWGEDGNDLLFGQFGNDVLGGGAGDDRILGGYGNDLLYGHRNNDILYGEFGNDILRGGDGHDQLWGGDDNDTLHGGWGRDTLLGGAGDDLLISNQGHDTLFGGTGHDQLWAGLHNDTLFGDGGHDTLAGESGHDTLYGGDGNDTLDGGAGNDLLVGGQGADTFIFNADNDVVQDFETGTDRIGLETDLWDGVLAPSDIVFLYGSLTNTGAMLDFGGGNTLHVDGINDLTQISASIDFI